MQLRLAASVTTLCVTLAAPRLRAQPAGSVEVGAYGQITRVDPHEARFESRAPLSLGVRGRVNLHRRFGVEMEASTGLVDGIGDPPRRRYNQLVARGTYTIPLTDFSALLVGGGVSRSDYEVTYHFGANALFGVRTAITGRYALRSDVIFNYQANGGATELGLRTGLQTTLGPFDGPTSRDRKRAALTMQEPGSLEVGMFGQQWQLNPIWNLRNGQSIGTRVGAFITSRSEVEVDATYGRQAVRVGGENGQTYTPLPGGATFRVTTFAFRYVHNLPVTSRLALVGGIGPSRTSYEYVDYWGVSGVAGARFAVTRDLQLRGDVVADYGKDSRVIDYAVRLGASTVVRLGR